MRVADLIVLLDQPVHRDAPCRGALTVVLGITAATHRIDPSRGPQMPAMTCAAYCTPDRTVMQSRGGCRVQARARRLNCGFPGRGDAHEPLAR